MAGGREVEGWTLNQSPGGIRAVLEEPLELGAELEVAVGDREARPGRIVWIQDEPDGAIVGIAFLDVDESPPGPYSGVEAGAMQPEGELSPETEPGQG